jgi:hypothetical protein
MGLNGRIPVAQNPETMFAGVAPPWTPFKSFQREFVANNVPDLHDHGFL